MKLVLWAHSDVSSFGHAAKFTGLWYGGTTAKLNAGFFTQLTE